MSTLAYSLKDRAWYPPYVISIIVNAYKERSYGWAAVIIHRPTSDTYGGSGGTDTLKYPLAKFLIASIQPQVSSALTGVAASGICLKLGRCEVQAVKLAAADTRGMDAKSADHWVSTVASGLRSILSI